MDQDMNLLYRVLKLIDNHQNFNYYERLNEQDLIFELVKMKLVRIEGQFVLNEHPNMQLIVTDKGKQFLKSYEMIEE
ncbi:hypothetical protein [Macrococcus sp. DPC7161]|uniref:hypothetical protein n=1 Tax=Macrococcus sp. DPC7161 TaxID=2507060 RepID=UPI00100B1EAC|nr:hypothetical protein [Macrococcus sp. DPC7161]RXK17241.1 hypothetical protein ER639_11550 [Macrococcus sp. DPC7161]